MKLEQIMQELEHDELSQYHKSSEKMRKIYLNDMDVMRDLHNYDEGVIREKFSIESDKALAAYENNPTDSNSKKLDKVIRDRDAEIANGQAKMGMLTGIRKGYKIQIEEIFKTEVAPLIVTAIERGIEKQNHEDAETADRWGYPVQPSPLTNALRAFLLRAKKVNIPMRDRMMAPGETAISGYAHAKGYGT